MDVNEPPIANLLNSASVAMTEGDVASAAAALIVCVEQLVEMDDDAIEATLGDLSPGALRLVAAHALSELRDLQVAALRRSDN